MAMGLYAAERSLRLLAARPRDGRALATMLGFPVAALAASALNPVGFGAALAFQRRAAGACRTRSGRRCRRTR